MAAGGTGGGDGAAGGVVLWWWGGVVGWRVETQRSFSAGGKGSGATVCEETWGGWLRGESTHREKSREQHAAFCAFASFSHECRSVACQAVGRVPCALCLCALACGRSVSVYLCVLVCALSLLRAMACSCSP